MLGWPLWTAYLVQRYVSGKSRPGWLQRWGRLPDSITARASSRPRIWVHAVSAGEVVAAVPIVREVRALLPGYDILISVITPAGMAMAEQQAAPHVDGLFFFPIDLPWVAKRVVEQVQPRVFISLESELWPNVLHELHRQGATAIMANGRITDRSFQRVRRFGSGLFRWMLSNMDRMLVQSDADASRIVRLGGDPGRVQVVGNSKFDQEIAELTAEDVAHMRAALKLPAQGPVFIAGSTRSAEEEACIIKAYLAMRASHQDLCLIIAPRHVARAAELAGAMTRAGLQPVRKTEVGAASIARHVILDTMGELADTYAVASFAFVGNTFPPTVNGGGQNLLQPLAHGKPVAFGPETATIRSEVALATGAGVGFQVGSSEQLADWGIGLLENEAERERIGSRARALVLSQRGVSRRYADIIAEVALAAAGSGR
ncbi:MAG TPA: glycosyltransferase N-terminal domain-containing protein [Chthonomonadaceae bacterium]|nr:glycosyltransferase N-terminal domain-containing protein [Chthonomonadaceae bacterium]